MELDTDTDAGDGHDASPVATTDDGGPLPLGYTRDNRFAFVLPQSRLLVIPSAGQLTSPSYLLGIAPYDYWAEKYPKDGGGFSAFAAGDTLIGQCRKAGGFNPLNVRGRGIWREGDEIVVNLGGPVPSPRYLCFEPIALDAGGGFDTARLLRLLEMFAWRNPADAVLMLGWFAVAPICGALSWRPHAWVHGPSKSGKTTLHALAKAICSPLALNCDGGSSEAGIRQTIGADSLPVIIDEFEGDQHQIKGVLRLARTASSAEDPLLRGSPEGKAMSFALRATFLFSSINPLGMSVADESRIVMLELTKHDQKSETAQKIDAETAHFRTQEGRWCAFMVARAAAVLRAIALFERKLPSGDRRHRQNMATLLGGAFVALGGGGDADVDQWVAKYAPTAAAHDEEHERDDGDECLDCLFSHTVRRLGHPDYPLEHWAALAIAGNGEARTVLKIHDMALRSAADGEASGLLVKNGSAAINRIFQGSRWDDGGWKRALRKLQGVEALGKTVKINGKACRATRIPFDLVGLPLDMPETEPGIDPRSA